MFERLKFMYETDMITLEHLKKAVVRKWITQVEMDEIVKGKVVVIPAETPIK